MGKILDLQQILLEIEYCKLCEKTQWGTIKACKIHKELIEDLTLEKSQNLLKFANVTSVKCLK